jgi:hypothetical protein
MRPVKSSGKILFVTLSALTLAVLIFFAGRYFLLSQIRQTLHNRLGDLREQGVILKFDSAKINTWSGDIAIHRLNISIRDSVDTTRINVSAAIPEVIVDGINIIPFLKQKNISIDHVSLRHAVITYRPSADIPQAETRNSFFQDLHIDNIDLSGSSFHLQDSVGGDTVATFHADLKIRNLGLERVADSLMWRESAVQISDFSFTLPDEYYSFSVKDVRLDLKKKSFEIDSLKVMPTLGRRAFMRKYGREIDYFKGVVPYVKISGLSMTADPSLAFQVNQIVANFRLIVFRDKRLPFIKDWHTQLPSEFIHKLPFKLNIDTLLLKDCFVSYEEFPAAGDSSGTVFFDHLYATAHSISNDMSKPHGTKMQARAKFMGTGNLLVNFTFPRDTNKAYTAAGWLRDFPMVKLNDMLGPAAKARVESGIMTNLEFHFRYNRTRSDGTVELNYENLKISSLRENKNHETKVSLIKTLLLNLFVIKKNMDEDTRDDRKTGTILFYRNTKRSIFNYWWKSIFSGIKSAYNLDKLQGPDKKEDKIRKKKSKKS